MHGICITELWVCVLFCLISAPIGQSDPVFTNISATRVHLAWESPEQPNGIISNYIVHRRTPSLLPSPAQNDVGVSFTGNGYATFEPSNPSKFENNLSLRFRTLDCCGIMFYSINTAQTDMFAVELRNGIPWLIFDAGTGPAAIRPESNTKFDDGAWHTLTVAQRGNDGTITVDNTYTGSGSSIGASGIIGYAVHHIGGIPSDAPLQTQNGHLNSSSVLSGQSFAGCLYNVIFNDVALDFSSGFPGVGSPDQGCPVDLVTTTQLLGGGYFSLAENTITGNSFNISFQFRTTHTDGLLYYMYASSSYMFGIELRSSELHLVLSAHDVTLPSTSDPCDGEWHRLTLSQEGDQLLFTVDEVTDSLVLPLPTLVFSSRIFFGGVPLDSTVFEMAQDAGLNIYTPFSGCIRIPEPLLHVAGQPVVATITESELVNFNGCGNSPGTSCVAPWSDVDAGMKRNITDTGLTPFSGIVCLEQKHTHILMHTTPIIIIFSLVCECIMILCCPTDISSLSLPYRGHEHSRRCLQLLAIHQHPTERYI